MEKELFFSGYCRALDQSRLVEVEICDSKVDADCAYPDCPYAPNCQIAQKIKEAEKVAILNMYADKIDEVISGEVEKVDPVLVNLGRTSVILSD